MKPIFSLVATAALLWVVGCFSYIPQDEWDDFVVKSCEHLRDQAAYNRCYRDGTRSDKVCYEADGNTICRNRPYGSCDRAKLGAFPSDQSDLLGSGLGCERTSPPDSE